MNVGNEVRIHRVITNAKKFSSLGKLAFAGAVLFAVLILPINFTPTLAIASADQSVNVWWPTDGAHVTGTQPFKAMVAGLDVNSYDMYWQVDGGGMVPMQNSSTDYPHKEAQVDVSGWTWHGSGPYVVTFVAKQNGTVVAQSSINLYVDNGLPVSGSTQTQTQTQVQ